jgi:hypothetical protein
MTAALGRLERVPLRDAWTSEAVDFTPWLAREENLKLLGDAIGLELELESQEEGVGVFRADMVCRDTATDGLVIVENQLERTDHTHLGQLLTYAAGLDAVTIVWIAARFNEEHRATLDWLNDRTDDKVNCYGLEIELVRIGDSPVAATFRLVSKPNDYSRTLKGVASGGAEVTQHKQLQLQFWTDFRAFMESQSSVVRCPRPSARHFMRHAAGRAGVQLRSIISSSNSTNESHAPEVRVELAIETADAKRVFAALEARKEEIETALGFPVCWHNPQDTATCKVYTRIDADWPNSQLWSDQFGWLRERLERMHSVFAPLVKNLGIDE